MLPDTPLRDQPFVVVDLETTGGSATFDRIIEVAAVRVERGEVQEGFRTLVDPCVPVPPFITRLTGITRSMLRGRPLIEAVLPDLERLSRGAVFVAHNASFDAGFVTSAFRRAGTDWSGEKLCTLRLARRLLPGLHSYKLDSLCAHLGFPFVQAHRAGPDADATVSLLQYLLEASHEAGMERVDQLLRLQMQPVSARRRKGNVDEALVASLPTGPGVYLLKDGKGHVVYVGKSVNVRTRVRTHLRPSGTANGHGQPRLRKKLPYIADVEAIETGSELEALFLESRLVKRYLPEANRLLRDYRDYPFIKLDVSDAFPRLVATRERPSDDALYFGPFRSAGTVASAVLFLTEQLGLRQCAGALKPGQSACPLLDLKKCLGPCVDDGGRAAYARAVGDAEQILRGEDLSLIERAAARRDRLAEELRFEEAAEMRDRIRDVQVLVGAQKKLQAVSERNLVIVAPDTGPTTARAFFVRAGRLVHELTLPLPPAVPPLRAALRSVYQCDADATVSRDQVDDMLILDAWLRHKGGGVAEIPVSLAAPEMAIVEIKQALGTLHATRRPAAAGRTTAVLRVGEDVADGDVRHDSRVPLGALVG